MLNHQDEQHIETMAAIILAGMYACPDPIKDAPKKALEQAYEIRRMMNERYFQANPEHRPDW